jgi:hypothetical protein
MLSNIGSRPSYPSGAFRLTQNRAAGSAFENFAQFNRRLAGETVFRTQFTVGAAQQGLDFGSFIETPEGIVLYLNEIKATAGAVPAGRFTSLGLGRGGSAVFDRDLLATDGLIREQFGGQLQQQLLDALRTRSSVRLIGPQGFGVSESTLGAVGDVTQRPVIVLIEK